MNHPSFPPRRRFESHLKRFIVTTTPRPTNALAKLTAARSVLPRDYALAYLRAERETDREIDGLWLDLGGG